MSGTGKLFVVSAPSGAGKTTLVQHILERFPNLSYSISSTTRPMRKTETHGIDYFFLAPEIFEEKIEKDEWLEWAKVHDNYYGTSKKVVQEALSNGKSLLLDIDVQGASQVMASDLDPVTIFIEPPSMDELERRLKKRDTDTDEVIQKRLKNAISELGQKEKYQYRVMNDDLKTAINALLDIFKRELGV